MCKKLRRKIANREYNLKHRDSILQKKEYYAKKLQLNEIKSINICSSKK